MNGNNNNPVKQTQDIPVAVNDSQAVDMCVICGEEEEEEGGQCYTCLYGD